MDNQTPGAGAPFTPERISALLYAAEYLMFQVEKTPKESIMTKGCVGAEECNLAPMPFIETRVFKGIAAIIQESRTLFDESYTKM